MIRDKVRVPGEETFGHMLELWLDFKDTTDEISKKVVASGVDSK